MQNPVPILHIDDDSSFTRIIAERLKKYGYLVESLQDGSRWEATIRRTQAGIILLDCDLGPIKGLDLIEQIMASPGNRRVIVLTGDVQPKTLNRAAQLGADYCFFKTDLDIQELAEAIQTLAFQRLHWINAVARAAAQSLESGYGLPVSQVVELPVAVAQRKYRANLPQASLQHASEYLCLDGFSGYLLETGRVSRSSIVAALQAAKEQTPKLGQLAIQQGMLNMKQIFHVLQEQSSTNELFGQAAVRLRYLVPSQLDQLLARQRKSRPKVLDILLAMEFVTSDQIKQAVLDYEALRCDDEQYEESHLLTAAAL